MLNLFIQIRLKINFKWWLHPAGLIDVTWTGAEKDCPTVYP